MNLDGTTPIFQELTSSGSESVSLTPGTATQTGTFQITGLPGTTDGKRNYTPGFWLHLSTVFDADGAGSAVNHDKLAKGLASARLFSPTEGEIYAHKQTRGAVLYHLIQVMGLGYHYPQCARAQIAANTDADTTIDLFFFLPLAHGFLSDPMEGSQWVGFFDQGVVEGTIDISTVYDGDYAGAVTKATTALRAFCSFIPSPRNYLGVPIQWREREIAGGGTQPTLIGIGQETQRQGLRYGCGLAAMAWLTNATGIGLSGPDGVDNITQIELPWRSQPLLRNLDPYFLDLRRAVGSRVGPVAGTGSTIIHDGAGWPFTMADTPSNRPAASGQSMFLLPVYPGRNAKTSKFQRLNGNYKVNLTTTDAISASHRVVTCEFMEYAPDKRDQLFSFMGLPPGAFQYVKRSLNGQSATENEVRYTRWYALPA